MSAAAGDSDFVKIMANTAWMVFDKVFILALNLFVSVKIANYYGALGYGSYQYVVSVAAVFEILSTFVDARVVKKKYLNNDPDLVAGTATAGRLLLSGVSAVLGVVFIALGGNDFEFSLMFVVLLLNIVMGGAKFGMANRFEFLLKSKKIVIASDLAALAASLLQLLAVQFYWPVVMLAVITLISTTISTLVIYLQYKKEFERRRTKFWDRQLLGAMLRESVPLAIAGSCAILYMRCDSIMLGAMLTAAEVGIYSVSVSLINVVQIAIAPIRESVYPKLLSLYQEDRSRYEHYYIKISSMLTWIYIVGVAFSFFVLPWAFRFLNAEYAQALSVYRIHILGTFFMYNAALRSGHFTLIDRGSVLTYSQLFSVAANIVMNVAGIRFFGIYGAALATVTTQAAVLMFSNLFFKEEGRQVFIWQIKALNPAWIFKN